MPGVTGYAEVVPDLVVEVASPNDSRPEINDKALMWLRYGVRLVWVVHPDVQTVEQYQEGRPVRTLTAASTLDGDEILPGFTCLVGELFES